MTTSGHPGTLQKQLNLRSLVLFGLAYMTPIIVLGIFGVIAELSDGGSAGSYLIATVAMLFTALSYGLMAKHFPVAGSAYTYVRKALDSWLGFVVGWAILLDYLFLLFLPLVIWLIGGSYLQGQFPNVPFFVWILAFIVITSALNVIGLRSPTGQTSC
jgi:putrescine importer